MEPERRKLFKKTIKTYSEPGTREKVKRKETVERNKNQGDSIKNVTQTVTILGSHSYMEQNKDLLMLQPLEVEKLSHNEENILQTKDDDQLQNKNVPLDIIANLNNKTPKKSPQAKKDNEVFIIKTPYKKSKAELKENISTEMNEKITSHVFQIEVEFEKENTENNYNEIIEECAENLSKTEVVRCQQEEKLHSEPNQEKEREKDESLENREHLTPTIMEIIPDKDMDIMRKSLEEENAQDEDFPSFSDNEDAQPKIKKRKRAVIKKSYVDFLSDQEDFVWDFSSSKETGESSSESELDNTTKRQKKNKKRSQETTVGEDGIRKKRQNKKKLNNQLKSSGQQYTNGSIVKEKRVLI